MVISYPVVFVAAFLIPSLRSHFTPLAAVAVVSALSALNFCVCFLSSRFAGRSIIDAARRIERARLDIEISFSRRGDVGVLTRRSNEYLDDFRYVIRESSDMSKQLTIFLDRVSAVTIAFSDDVQKQASPIEEITASIGEISAGIDSIQLDFDNLTNFTTRIGELSAIVGNVGQQIGDASRLVNDISAKTSFGEDIMSRISSNMSMISDSSQKMTAIAGIINDISDQINLLALNASIEAARGRIGTRVRGRRGPDRVEHQGDRIPHPHQHRRNRKRDEQCGGIGHYGFEVIHDRKFRMVCDNPYPCEFDKGIIEAMAYKFKPADARLLRILHDDSAPCRKKRGDSCT